MSPHSRRAHHHRSSLHSHEWGEVVCRFLMYAVLGYVGIHVMGNLLR